MTAIAKLRDVQCLRKSLTCTCILYLFHLKDCNGVLLVVDVATQRQIQQNTIRYHAADAAISFFDTR